MALAVYTSFARGRGHSTRHTSYCKPTECRSLAFATSGRTMMQCAAVMNSPGIPSLPPPVQVITASLLALLWSCRAFHHGRGLHSALKFICAKWILIVLVPQPHQREFLCVVFTPVGDRALVRSRFQGIGVWASAAQERKIFTTHLLRLRCDHKIAAQNTRKVVSEALEEWLSKQSFDHVNAQGKQQRQKQFDRTQHH